jgi:hypothetical protein
VLLLFLVSSACAETIDTIQYRCLEELQGDREFVDSIVVLTNEDKTVEGKRATVNFQLSLLRVKQAIEPEGWKYVYVSVDFDDINEITYRKTGHQRTGMTYLGGVLGLVVGGCIGNAVAPEPDEFMDQSKLEYSFAGALIGAAVGGLLGHVIGSGMSAEVTLKCW